MRQIEAKEITEAVKEAAIAANYELGADLLAALKKGQQEEESPAGREIFRQLLENARIASEGSIPLCQDCGLCVVFVELGQEVRIVGGDFQEAIQEGVRQGYGEGFLRKSLCHPLTRQNTGDNTPAVIHLDLVPGDRLKLMVVPKGGGSENMSRLFMLKPAEGVAGIREKVVTTVREAGPNPCPPIIVGVGIGGTMERAALLAKKALLREVGQPNPDPEVAALEKQLLQEVNDLGIGPQGLGGRLTALAVHVLMQPCHIASLPVAVNIQCHASRHQEVFL
ncbi:MAG: fumarate hydratase [Deltaproteobacteria bacterium RBG_13_58_19]|nr:MAG: fumarate hydratase [Deltaproteobacteria bacterium RBG_13_58_19]